MQVKDLIEKLHKFDPEANVYTYDEQRYNYWLTSDPQILENWRDENDQCEDIKYPAIRL